MKNKKLFLRIAVSSVTAVVTLAAGASLAGAALTFTATNVSSDGALTVDGTGAAMTIGPNATAITIGSSSLNVLFPGNVSTTGSVAIGDGTAISKYSCATATWNPGSVATSTLAAVTSTNVALTGAVLGDLCLGSLTSATTSDAQVQCNITGTATATISLTNVGAAALDLATGTAKVCYIH